MARLKPEQEELPTNLRKNKQALIEFIRSEMTYPYPQLAKRRLHLLSDDLYLLWIDICRKYMVDNETSFCKPYMEDSGFCRICYILNE